MKLFHEPLGWAREISPLALRIYDGCDLNCTYCGSKSDDGPTLPGDVRPLNNFRKRLATELAHQPITQQVLVGYPGDPYCYAETRTHGHTRFAIDLLHEYQVPAAILTRMGTVALRDMDLFTTMPCKVGVVLTFDNDMDSLTWEPGAALPDNRITMLQQLRDAGVRTWACLEPTIDPAQTLAMIDRTHAFVDEYRVSMPMHIRRELPIDWRRFAGDVVDRLREYSKPFYIARSLHEYVPGLTVAETDPDRLTLTMETAVCA